VLGDLDVDAGSLDPQLLGLVRLDLSRIAAVLVVEKLGHRDVAPQRGQSVVPSRCQGAPLIRLSIFPSPDLQTERCLAADDVLGACLDGGDLVRLGAHAGRTNPVPHRPSRASWRPPGPA